MNEENRHLDELIAKLNSWFPNDTMDKLYDSGYTKRYHNRKGIEQAVGQHSWGVALIIMFLHPNPSINLLKAAIVHDLHEKDFGDIPSPTKRMFPEARELDGKMQTLYWEKVSERSSLQFPELTQEEIIWLNFADSLECCFFVSDDLQNKDKIDIFSDALASAVHYAETIL